MTSYQVAMQLFTVMLVSGQAGALVDEETTGADQSTRNGGETLSWEEVQSAHGPALESRGWDKRYVLDTFDHDHNEVLDEEEHRMLIVSLQVKNPDESATAMGSETDAADSHISSGAANAVITPQEKANATLAERPSPMDTTGGAADSQGKQDDAVYQIAIKDLKGKTLNNLQREPLGQVEQVVVNPRAGTLGLVVRFGGILGKNATASVVPIERVELTRDQKLVWNTTKTTEQIQEMAEYRSEDYVSVSPEEFPTLDAVRDELLSTAGKH